MTPYCPHGYSTAQVARDECKSCLRAEVTMARRERDAARAAPFTPDEIATLREMIRRYRYSELQRGDE